MISKFIKLLGSLAAIVIPLGAWFYPFSPVDQSPITKTTQPEVITNTPQPEKFPDATCHAGTISVNALRLTTSSADSQIVEGDDELDSDDWTSIELSYNIHQVNANEVQITLLWYAQEYNSDRSKRGTRIASSKTFILFPANSLCPNLRIDSINGLQLSSSRVEYYHGKIHDFVSFPNVGSLYNIYVRFDGKGEHDQLHQALKADLSDFSVNLSSGN
ncbi:MAG TPA: hypothetical protein VJX74_17325 [Blastocatellia bacterium]|nr:hypothetical protein [Blastocatellia bacterium]